MEIRNKRVMVLGGWGLVGMAICRRMLDEAPDELIVSSLMEEEAREACDRLRSEAKTDIRLTPVWGDIFVRDAMQGKSHKEILNDPTLRLWLIEDVLGDLTEELLSRMFLFQIIQQYRPHIIVDCVNSATAVAYQDVFTAYFRLKKELGLAKKEEACRPSFIEETEKMLCTLYIPQLIRHVQILYEAMRRARTEAYLKIGTSGTGGMGLNIPYTHSEEKPSRVLLSKSAVAGAHTLLLFLMARTPDAPITKEIKPTAAIAWKRIEYGKIYKHGRPVELYDCPPDKATVLEGALKLQDGGTYERLDKKYLESVYIDTGENGIFSLGEFSAITSPGQMEFVTPEEIAKNVIYELKGGNTGHDIINALDNAVMGPTYRAGVLRHFALEKMHELVEEHGVDSVAFELLGPPRLSKLLWEADLLRRVAGTMASVCEAAPEDLAARWERLILEDATLRSEIISIGIPILLSDGKRLLRGPEIKIPSFRGENEYVVTDELIDRWAMDGWVDLRVENVKVWQRRMGDILEEIRSIPETDTSSKYDRNREYWLEDKEINIGKVVGWIFSMEEKGLRMKD
jgi:hypothetical protein